VHRGRRRERAARPDRLRDFHNLRESGFTGTLGPVHPSAGVIEGLRAYPTVRDIPEAVDLAVVVVPAARVAAVVDDCLAKGVKAPYRGTTCWRDAAGRLRGAVKPADVERVTVASTIASPVGEILRYAATEDVDLIVMGTHGRGGVSHMLLGSIAEPIVRRAPCPVLTVRYPEHGFVETQALVGVWAQAPTASAT
jgi:nucleotide-binding universal stress UspA family protein